MPDIPPTVPTEQLEARRGQLMQDQDNALLELIRRHREIARLSRAIVNRRRDIVNHGESEGQG